MQPEPGPAPVGLVDADQELRPEALDELPEGWTVRVSSTGQLQYVPPGATLSNETTP